jgi:hypothetical protein
MNRLASSQFKTQYPHLMEPTEVNVNGHYIGTWLPADPQRQRVDEPITPGTLSPSKMGLLATEPNTLKEDPQRARRERQKRIDAVLRKANKP